LPNLKINNEKHKIMRYLLIILLASTLFQSCRKDFEFQDFDYKTYNRVVGPEGGKINFYANYGNDKKNELIVGLDVPKGALDSQLVFNMYQFEDYELTMQMEDGFAKFGSKFIYFVPFLHSEGYYERGQTDLNYQLSVEFNQPLTVSYYPLADYSDLSMKNWQEVELYHNYYKTTNKSYKVFRIKIPKVDEWGQDNNIYVNWTRQGYPNGYDRTDLSYIINGRWSAFNPWGTGNISLENWELVSEHELDFSKDKISFKIYNTNYIYVLARLIYIPPVNVPLRIKTYISSNFGDIEISRAAYDGKKFKIYLSDNSIAVFNKNNTFEYLTRDNLPLSEIPYMAVDYISTNFPKDPVKRVSSTQMNNMSQYEVLLSSGVKLIFDYYGSLIGIYQFGYDPKSLPPAILTYIESKFPGQQINNVTYSVENYENAMFIVYMSSNAKVFFDKEGNWFETSYYKINSTQLPDAIKTYFDKNHPNSIFSSINRKITTDGEFYEINTVGNRWFYFSKTGDLLQFEFSYLSEKELPSTILTYINTNFPTSDISTISHYMVDETERYDIYFSDLLNIEFDKAGILKTLYGTNILHLPLTVRNFIITNHQTLKVTYCNYSDEPNIVYLPSEEVLTNWQIQLTGKKWIGLTSTGSFAYMEDFEVTPEDIIKPIQDYLIVQHPNNAIYYISQYNSANFKQLIYYVMLDNYSVLIFDRFGNFLTRMKSATNKPQKKVIQREIQEKRLEAIQKSQKIETNSY
jgi:hypothetical protein